LTHIENQIEADVDRVQAEANSRDDVRLTPTSLAFGQIAPGAEPKASVQLSIGEANLSIVDVKTDSAFIQAQAKPMSSDGGASFEITAQVRGKLPVGSWYTTVWLTTNNPAVPRLSIPVTVEVKGE